MKVQFVDARDPDAAPVMVEVRRVGPISGAPGVPARFEVVLPSSTSAGNEAASRLVQVTAQQLEGGGLRLERDATPFSVLTSRQVPPPGSVLPPLRHVAWRANRFELQVQEPEVPGAKKRARHDGHDGSALTSSMPGQVLKVLVQEGQEVAKGQTLLIIEAMKMEHEVKSPMAGRVKKLGCVQGAMVSPGVPLVELEPVAMKAV